MSNRIQQIVQDAETDAVARGISKTAGRTVALLVIADDLFDKALGGKADVQVIRQDMRDWREVWNE